LPAGHKLRHRLCIRTSHQFGIDGHVRVLLVALAIDGELASEGVIVHDGLALLGDPAVLEGVDWPVVQIEFLHVENLVGDLIRYYPLDQASHGIPHDPRRRELRRNDDGSLRAQRGEIWQPDSTSREVCIFTQGGILVAAEPIDKVLDGGGLLAVLDASKVQGGGRDGIVRALNRDRLDLWPAQSQVILGLPFVCIERLAGDVPKGLIAVFLVNQLKVLVLRTRQEPAESPERVDLACPGQPFSTVHGMLFFQNKDTQLRYCDLHRAPSSILQLGLRCPSRAANPRCRPTQATGAVAEPIALPGTLLPVSFYKAHRSPSRVRVPSSIITVWWYGSLI